MKKTKSNNQPLFRMIYKRWNNMPAWFPYLYSTLIFLFFSTFSFSSPQKDTLIFGSDQFFPPYEYINENGQAEGFNIDIVHELAREMNVEIVIKLGDWVKIRHELEVDVTVDFSDMFYGEKRDSAVDYAFPHDIVYNKVYLHKSAPPILDISELNDKKVAVLRGSVLEEYLQTKYPDVILIPQATESDALQMVSKNLCDAAIVTNASGKELLNESKTVIGYGNMILPSEYSFVVKEGNTELLKNINLALANLIANGTIEKLRKKWFDERIFGIRQNLLKLGIVVLLLSLLISYLLNFILTRGIRRRNKQLYLSDERWNFALEGAGDGIWDWNLKTNEIFFSTQWKKMLGYNENDIGNTVDEWDKLVHPDDKKMVYFDINKHISGETREYKNEYRILCKDGTYKWILDRGKVMGFDKHGKPLRLIGTHTDISGRIKDQEIILLNEKRFRLISGVTSDYMFESKISEKGYLELIWTFGAFENITGYKPEEYIANGGWRASIHPDDLIIDDKDIEKLQKNQKVVTELRTYTKQGELIWVRVYAHPIWDDEKQKLTGIYGAVQDITGRKEAEEALIISEDKFRRAFKISPDSINLNRLSDGTYLEINKGFEKIMGYSSEEIIGKSSIKLNIWKNLSDREKMLNGLKENGFVENLEAEFISRNGKIITGLMSANIIELNKEKAILSITRDITERKTIETKLIENEERFRTIFEQSASGMCLTSIEGNLITVNTPLCEMLSYSQEELVGLHYNSITHPDDLNIGVSAVKRMMSGEIKKAVFEKRYLKKSGKIIWVHINTALLRDEHFNKKYFITQLEDITPRIESDLALKSSENKFKALVEQSLTGIYILEKDNFIYVNSRFCEIFGYSENEIITSMKPTDVISAEDRERADENIRRRLQGEIKSVNYVAKGNHKTGKPLWVEIHGTHLEIEGKDVITGTILDITDRKIAEEEIRKLNEELEEKVAERTSELETKVSEIQRLNNLFVGRELRMKELKTIIKEMENRLNDKTKN